MQDKLRAQGAQSTNKTRIAVGHGHPASPLWAISLTRTVSLISQKMRLCREVPGFAWVATVCTIIVTTHSDRDVRPRIFVAS